MLRPRMAAHYQHQAGQLVISGFLLRFGTLLPTQCRTASQGSKLVRNRGGVKDVATMSDAELEMEVTDLRQSEKDLRCDKTSDRHKQILRRMIELFLEQEKRKRNR
jgi:hypothetical protein